jgi:hypothetical protein
MKTVKQLIKAYNSVKESASNDPDVAVAQRNIYLAIERLKYSSNVKYFYNERGDYSLVENLSEENERHLGHVKTEETAKTLVFALNQK